ncbi:hypothetical protein [Flavobacterium urumqiense]|uniref:Uncharacterized protein n=1 Tax=Flavobacterium urumqiense TaxID=935224 RepID=A0A1H6A7A2_9FLAO|nr:hypothetical protein [Flavobacterium urumqiense]SEG44619.1 hypothetical protein SAMN04488130_11423 [Flavobacterium urumqiense]
MNDTKAVLFAIPEKLKCEQITKILFLIKCNYEGIKVQKKVIDFAKVFDAYIDAFREEFQKSIKDKDIT